MDQLRDELGDGLNAGPIARRQALRIQTLEKTIRRHENSRHTPGQATP
ncbi:hypothetical protein ACWDGI_13185 [Streptomyces sp. NPDC001220]